LLVRSGAFTFFNLGLKRRIFPASSPPIQEREFWTSSLSVQPFGTVPQAATRPRQEVLECPEAGGRFCMGARIRADVLPGKLPILRIPASGYFLPGAITRAYELRSCAITETSSNRSIAQLPPSSEWTIFPSLLLCLSPRKHGRPAVGPGSGEVTPSCEHNIHQ